MCVDYYYVVWVVVMGFGDYVVSFGFFVYYVDY